MPSFHTETHRLLPRVPRESQRAINQVEKAERRLGIPLPPAVREWYSCGTAVRILASYSNDDPPIPVREFALKEWDSKLLLPFKYENQGVCEWAILMDGSDNPAVYVNVDHTGWQQQTSTFSDYVYSCVWDYVAFAKPALVQAQNSPISDDALRRLSSEFTEQLITYGWPGETQYRFIGNQLAILIWAADDQADWFVAADDAASLRNTLEVVWSLDGVGESFYDCSEIGRTVLDELKEGSSGAGIKRDGAASIGQPNERPR